MRKRMLAVVLALCMAFTLLPGTAWAAGTPPMSGTCGENVNWSYDVVSKTLKISGTGDMEFPESGAIPDIPWEPFVNEIAFIEIGQGITTISTHAFSNCERVTKIVIPSSVKQINNHALHNMRSLEEVIIESGLETIGDYAFYMDYNLKSISLPSSVKKICAGAFEHSGLITIDIPASVEVIEPCVFKKCYNLTNINISENNAHYCAIGNVLFDKGIKTLICHPGGCSQYDIPEGVETVAQYAFKGANIAEVRVPASVKAFSPAGGSNFYFYGNAPSYIFAGPSAIDGSSIVYYPAGNTTWTDIVFTPNTWHNSPPTTWIEWNPFYEILYSVTYDLNGGVGEQPAAQYYRPEDEITLITGIPEKDGYTFGGWSDGTKVYQIGENMLMPAKDIVLTAVWKENITVDANMLYVQSLTDRSLANADSETKTIVQNAVSNLLFKAQYRPTTSTIPSSMVSQGSVSFTGTLEVNKTWPVQNNHSYAYSVTDGVLGQVKFAEGAAGCMSYALFATAYTYGTSGTGIGCTNLSAAGIKSFIQKYADPGEQLRYCHNRNAHTSSHGPHSIVFLGESADGSGFYYISYGGGMKSSGKSNHELYVGFYTYQQFANTISCYLTVRDANGGSYYSGTARSAASVRAGAGVTKTILRIACPVEAAVRLENEVLDSRNPGTASFGEVQRINDEIVFTLDHNFGYDLAIDGTGSGTMTLTLEYYVDETLADIRTIVNLPIESDTEIQSSAFDPLASFVLYVNPGSAEETAWGAGINETVYAPNDEYSSVNNDLGEDSSIPSVPPTYPTYPSKPSTPPSTSTAPTTPTTTPPTPTTPAEPEQPVQPAEPEMPAEEPLPFTDVAKDAYYYDAVRWAVAQGITTGAAATTFAPGEPCTRGQVVTFLWRAAGSPSPQGSGSPFLDVKPGAYYYDAVLWAVEQGITSGTSATAFSPDETVTRGQTAAFLYRAAGSPAVSGSNPFADVDSGAYYADAVRWAAAQGIASGTSDTMFSPDDACTRAHIVTFLYRAKQALRA